MFTGIVQEVGEVEAVAAEPNGARIVVRMPGLAPDVAMGDSVAVNGTCLTAVELGPVLLLCGPGAAADQRAAVEAAGVETAEVADLPAGLALLHGRGIQSVLCEGGAGLAGALLGADLVDRMLVVTAPMLLGDPAAPGLLGDTGRVPQAMADALALAAWSCERIGDDLWIDAWVHEPR